MTYEIAEFDGHMIIAIDEGRFLVDTGSPTSFARGRLVSFGGTSAGVGDSAMGVLDPDELSGHVGTRLDGLIGMDVLRQHRLTFVQNRLFVGDGEEGMGSGATLRDSDFVSLDTDDFMGIPVVSLNVNQKTVRMFVDTGAKVSYLDPDMLAEFTVEETIHDFYPGMGEFDVGVSEVWADLKGWPLKAKFGRLPALLQMSLMVGGVNGIIGRDLFNAYSIRIERGGNPVSFYPHI